MKVKYANGGGVGDPPQTGDPVRDYIARIGGPQSIQNTFGPIDYVAGAFPIGRVLAPYAARVMNALGLGDDAGVNLARQSFSNRFGRGAKSKDRALMRELRETAGDTRVIDQLDPYMGYQMPTTQEMMGMAKAAPPTRVQGVGGGATARQTEGLLANEMEAGAVDELINKFLNDPILMAERKNAMGKARFYDEPFSMLEEQAIEAVEGMVDQFGHVIDPRVATNKAGKRFLAEPPRGGRDIDFPNLQPRMMDRFVSPQSRMNDAVRVVKDVEGDILQQLARAYKRQGQ